MLGTDKPWLEDIEYKIPGHDTKSIMNIYYEATLRIYM